MRDQDQRLVAHHRFEAVFDHLLGRIVHVAGRLVEDQDVRVPHQRAGQGHGLTLAAGQGHAPLADLRPEPGRVGTDELRHARQRGRPQDHLVVANRMEKSPAFESGGAGLASTLDDYMKFAMNSAIGSMDEDIDASKEGKDILIGFNPRFLMDALRVIDEDEITMYMINPKAPCFIRDQEETYIYLILPVNFNV